MLTYCMQYVYIALKYIACSIHFMIQNGYLELIERRNQLSSPLFDGVKAAREHLHLINFKIRQIEKDPNIFDRAYIHQKPGFTLKMLSVLVAQANRGSITSEIEIRKYADWVISQMSVGQ